MADKVYQMNYAGHPVTCSFLYPQTRYYFHPLPKPVDGVEPDLRVTPDLIAEGRNYLTEESSDPYVEYRCFMELTGRRLLTFGCCVFHAVSFVWRDRAWLLTAPSGVGKTTQFLNWQRLFPGEITMISGDMPVLEGREDGSVWVHPSSWNGKENLFSRQYAPLGGLVLLEQGREDRIQPLQSAEAVIPLFMQFMAVPETENEIRALAKLMEQLLTAAPCWKLINRGGDASTELLRKTLADSIGKEAG